MTKIVAQCTRHCAALVLKNFSLPFPSFFTFARSLSLQSFLPVDCSVLLFAPWFHLHMLLTVALSHTFLLWYPTPDYSLFSCWTCVYCLWWILDLLFLLLLPHPSNIYLPLFSLFLPSPLMCVSCGCFFNMPFSSLLSVSDSGEYCCHLKWQSTSKWKQCWWGCSSIWADRSIWWGGESKPVCLETLYSTVQDGCGGRWTQCWPLKVLHLRVMCLWVCLWVQYLSWVMRHLPRWGSKILFRN